jgi:hypothetical protein
MPRLCNGCAAQSGCAIALNLINTYAARHHDVDAGEQLEALNQRAVPEIHWPVRGQRAGGNILFSSTAGGRIAGCARSTHIMGYSDSVLDHCRSR